MPAKKRTPWAERALLATSGSRFGAIIHCALRVQSRLPESAEKEPTPRFCGGAIVTSDGFVMCDFIDRGGVGHLGAFVGSFGDFKRNQDGLAIHLRLTPKERFDFFAVLSGWIATDYRS